MLEIDKRPVANLLIEWSAELKIKGVTVCLANGMATPTGVEVDRIYTNLSYRRKKYATTLLQGVCKEFKALSCTPYYIDNTVPAKSFWHYFNRLPLPNTNDSD